MNQKSWDILRIVAGLYLTYLGVKSMITAVTERPESMVFLLVMSVIFIIVGVWYTIYAIRRKWKRNQEESFESQEETEETEDGEDSENSEEEIAEDNEEDDSEEEED